MRCRFGSHVVGRPVRLLLIFLTPLEEGVTTEIDHIGYPKLSGASSTIYLSHAHTHVQVLRKLPPSRSVCRRSHTLSLLVRIVLDGALWYL